jgi:hypothetical protein
MKIKNIILTFFLLVQVLFIVAQGGDFKFNNQSDNVEVNAVTPAKVNIVCSNDNVYQIKIIPDGGINKIHLRILAPKANLVLYDNAKDGYKLEKTLSMDNSLVIMLELSIVATESQLEDEDFISHGWVAMLIQNKLK